MKFEYYNETEFKSFLNRLPDKDRYKLLTIIIDVEKYGLLTAFRMQWVKKIGNNLYEIRSRFAKNCQRCLYFHLVGQQYIITNYFTKKSDKTPINEINEAVSRRNHFKRGAK